MLPISNVNLYSDKMNNHENNISRCVDKAQRILVELRSMIKNLSTKNRKIAEFIINNWRDPDSLTLNNISKKTGVSEASIIKLSKSLNCSGFKELKQLLATLVAANPKDLYYELSLNDPPVEIVRKVFLNTVQDLQDTMVSSDTNQIIKAAEYISNANYLLFIGVGGSAAVASDAYHKFFKIGFKGNFFSDAHLQAMSASMLDEHGICIAISHSGRTKTILEALELAKKQNAKTISLTNSRLSPISRFSDITLYSSARDVPLTGENATARICQLAIIDAIFNLVCTMKYNQSISMLNRTQESVINKRI